MPNLLIILAGLVAKMFFFKINVSQVKEIIYVKTIIVTLMIEIMETIKKIRKNLQIGQIEFFITYTIVFIICIVVQTKQ